MISCESFILEKQVDDRPRDPIGPPSLIPERSTERAGQFIIDLSGAALQPQADEVINRTAIPAVVFLLRFEEVNSQNVSFNWTVSVARECKYS